MSTKVNPAKQPETDILKEICSSRSLTAKALQPETFWQLLAEFPWREAAVVYWYRLRPVIDRRRAGQRFTYIDVWPLNDGESLDQDRLVARFGEGIYRGRLSDKNRPGQHKEVANAIVKINDPEHPAWIEDLRELVTEDSDNRTYIQGLRAAGTKLPWDTGTPLGVDETAATALARMNSELLAERKSAPEAPPPKDPFEIAAEMQTQGFNQARILSELSGSGTEGLVGVINTLLEGQSKLHLEMIKQAGGKKTGISEFKELFEIVTMLRDSNRGEVAESPVTSLFTADSIRAMNELIGTAMAAYTTLRGGGPAPGGVTVGGLPAVVNPSAAPGASDQPSEPGEKVPMNLAGWTAMGDKAYEAFQRGAGGAAFARAMSVYDPETYTYLAALKQPYMMSVLKAHPGIWQILAPQAAAVEQFIAEFLAAGDAGEEGADDSGLQAV